MFNQVCVGSMPMEGLTGAGLVLGNPNLADPEQFVLTLMPGSVALDSGAFQPWMASSTDADGNPRVRGSGVDIGALEFNRDPLACWFVSTETAGWTPLAVTLKAYVTGSNTVGLTYCWDTDGNGSWNHCGPGLNSLLVVYDVPGDYAVKLLVTNAGGESNSWVYGTPIHVAPGIIVARLTALRYTRSAPGSPPFQYPPGRGDG